MQHFKLDKLFKMLCVLVIAIIIFVILKYSLVYIYPFFIVIIFAFILNPVVTYTEKKLRISRSIATNIVMGTIFSLFILFGYFLIQRIILEIIGLLDSLPEKMNHIKITLHSVGQTVYDRSLDVFPLIGKWNLFEEMDHILDNVSTYVINRLSDLLVASTNTLSSITYVFVVLTFILLSVYMLTKDFALFKSYFFKIMPDKIIFHFHPVVKHAKISLFGLMKAQLFITTISTIIIATALYFFHIEHVLTLSILLFFVDFIPYMGIGIIFLPWILYLFFTSEYVLTIELALLYLFIVMLRQIIEPKIIAKEIGIHPFIALSILFIGIQTLGILGIFITPFILICVSALHRARIFHVFWAYLNNN